MREEGGHFRWRALPKMSLPEGYEKQNIEVVVYEADALFDSAEATYAHFHALYRFIWSVRSRYHGFLILHGTDTLSYAACALHFFLLGKSFSAPILLTGAQTPLQRPNSDALINFWGALRVLSDLVVWDEPPPTTKQSIRIPRTAIFFDNTLLDGLYTVKVDGAKPHAMDSPNYPILASFRPSEQKPLRGNAASYELPQPMYQRMAEWLLAPSAPPRVCVLLLFPFMELSFVRRLILHAKPRAVVLLLYGAGTAAQGLAEAITAHKEVLFVGLSQCLYVGDGALRYPTQTALEQAGLVSMHPHTLPFVLTLLPMLLAGSDSVAVCRERLKTIRDFYADLPLLP